MKYVVLKKIKKIEGKVFTRKKISNTIKKNYNPFEVNCKIYKRRDGLYNMEKETVLKEMIFINEEKYQQLKKIMGKKDDYFTEKELEKLA